MNRLDWMKLLRLVAQFAAAVAAGFGGGNL